MYTSNKRIQWFVHEYDVLIGIILLLLGVLQTTNTTVKAFSISIHHGFIQQTTSRTTTTLLKYANDPEHTTHNDNFRQAFESLSSKKTETTQKTLRLDEKGNGVVMDHHDNDNDNNDMNDNKNNKVNTNGGGHSKFKYDLPPVTNKHQQVWNDKYLQLVEYYQEYGHSHVPSNYPTNPALGAWVLHQRQCYKKQTLIPSRIRALEQVHFTWTKTTSWDIRFQQLQEFQQEYGHCFVPTRYTVNPQLGRWLANQKQHYRIQCETRNHNNNGTTTTTNPQKEQDDILISQDRIQKLIDIGAIVVVESSRDITTCPHDMDETTCHHEPSKSSTTTTTTSVRDLIWHERYNELVQYQKEHGHCHVPRQKQKEQEKGTKSKDTTTTTTTLDINLIRLGNWVDTQRTNYRLYMKQEQEQISSLSSTMMTKERKELLDQIGFHLPIPATHKTATTRTRRKQGKKKINSISFSKTNSNKKNKTTTSLSKTLAESTLAVYKNHTTNKQQEQPYKSTTTTTTTTTRSSTSTIQNWMKRTNHHGSTTSRMITNMNNKNKNNNIQIPTTSSKPTRTPPAEYFIEITTQMTNEEKLVAWKERFKELQ